MATDQLLRYYHHTSVWHLDSRPARWQRPRAAHSDPPRAVGEPKADGVTARSPENRLSSHRRHFVDIGPERVPFTRHRCGAAGQSIPTSSATTQPVARHAKRFGGVRATSKGVEPPSVVGGSAIDSIERARFAVQRIALRLKSFVDHCCAVAQRGEVRDAVGLPTRTAGGRSRRTPQRGGIDGERDHFPLFVRPVRIDHDRERRVAAGRTRRRDEQR